MAKEILFRLNAGKKFGLGHLSRNLTLAEVFSSQKIKSSFLIHTDNENKVITFIKNRNRTDYEFTFINEDLDTNNDISIILQNCVSGKSFLILDHYNHDLHYQEELKSAGIPWAQFDYKQENQIIADIVINPNVGVKECDYDRLIGGNTKLCVGERFAIINEAFKKTEVKPKPDRILIAMGGGYYPQDVVDMIASLVSDESFRFDLITTQVLFNKKLKERNNVEIHNNPNNIADIYARNHAAVVAGGVTTYELAYLDVPMIVVPYTENQQKNAEIWQKIDHAIKFSSQQEFIKNLQTKSLKVILSDLYSRYKKESKLIDGQGAERIVETIKNR